MLPELECHGAKVWQFGLMSHQHPKQVVSFAWEGACLASNFSHVLLVNALAISEPLLHLQILKRAEMNGVKQHFSAAALNLEPRL